MEISHVKYQGDLRTEAIHLRSEEQITTDAPVDNQGKGEYFSPTDLLATSLASCMLTIMGIAARSHGFNIDGTQAKVSKVMGVNPRRVVEVIIELSFCHELTSKEKRLVELCAKECPVANSLHPDLIQTVIFNFK